MCSSRVPFVDGIGGLDDLRIGLFRGLELRVVVGTTGCHAGPLKRRTLVRTQRERFALRKINVIP